MNSEPKNSGRLDVVGAFASWMCVIHCIALPLVASALPLLGLEFLLEETTERLLILFSLVIAVFSLWPGYFRGHRNVVPIILASSAITTIFLSHLFLDDNFVLRAAVLIPAAGLLCVAHLLNRRLCRHVPA